MQHWFLLSLQPEDFEPVRVHHCAIQFLQINLSLHIHPPLVLFLWRALTYRPPFTGRETQAQKGGVTCSGLHSEQAEEQGLEPKELWLQRLVPAFPYAAAVPWQTQLESCEEERQRDRQGFRCHGAGVGVRAVPACADCAKGHSSLLCSGREGVLGVTRRVRGPREGATGSGLKRPVHAGPSVPRADTSSAQNVPA